MPKKQPQSNRSKPRSKAKAKTKAKPVAVVMLEKDFENDNMPKEESAAPSPEPATETLPETELPPTARVKKSRHRVIWLGLLLTLTLCGAVILSPNLLVSSSPVPKDIRKSVSFAVYYPDPEKLPAGYKLDTTSFRMAEPGVVLYSVSYGAGRSMVFSEQAKPSAEVMEKFNSTAIPIHTGLPTPLGRAETGAYGSGNELRTITSLPINNGPWLIVTAPSDINQDELSKIIRSLVK